MKTVAEKQPSTPPKAKKHKSMDSDEDDSRTSKVIKDQQLVRKDQLQVLILVRKTVRKATSVVHKVSDSGRTMVYSDLCFHQR